MNINQLCNRRWSGELDDDRYPPLPLPPTKNPKVATTNYTHIQTQTHIIKCNQDKSESKRNDCDYLYAYNIYEKHKARNMKMEMAEKK